MIFYQQVVDVVGICQQVVGKWLWSLVVGHHRPVCFALPLSSLRFYDDLVGVELVEVDESVLCSTADLVQTAPALLRVSVR
jgi:hypothetical protein